MHHRRSKSRRKKGCGLCSQHKRDGNSRTADRGRDMRERAVVRAEEWPAASAMSVREKLDALYGRESSALDPGLAGLQAKALRVLRRLGK